MKVDILEVINKKRWTADQNISKVKTLASIAHKLPDEVKQNIPIYKKRWTEEYLIEYIDTLSCSIRNPIRHKNRSILENKHIKTKGLPEEILENTKGIEDILSYIDIIDERIASVIVEKDYLTGWLVDGGMQRALDALHEINNANKSFQKVLDSDVDDIMKEDMIVKSIENVAFVNDAKLMIEQTEDIKFYGVKINYTTPLESFKANLIETKEKLSILLEEYKITQKEISTKLEGLNMTETEKRLSELVDYCKNRMMLLHEEYKMYEITLKYFDLETKAEPSGVNELSEVVEEQKKIAKSKLGEQGFRILQFLSKNIEYPQEITREEMKKTLMILRPIFKKGLREEQ